MRPKTLMNIARVVATDSKCTRRKVGAVIAIEGRLVTTGINGTPEGQQNCSEAMHHLEALDATGKVSENSREVHSRWSATNEIHAEMNALLFAAKHGIKVEGGVMYTTLAPCSQCAKAIAQSGIRQVVYAEEYYRNDTDWKDIFTLSGISVEKIEDD